MENSQPILHDRVTGLLTHSQFRHFLDEKISRVEEFNSPSSLLLIDPDIFSAINNRHGYLVGDKALLQIGQIIQKTLRDFDVTSRFEATTFAAYLADADSDQAFAAAERIRHLVRQADIFELTVSIGVATCPQDASQSGELVRLAKEALMQAKIRGKNRVCLHESAKVIAESEQTRVLVVDDNKENRKLLKAYIDPLGYEVVLLPSAEEMFNFLKRGETDLILLDVMMPGMDGFRACERLKNSESTRHIPVIMITALDDVDSKIKGIEAGADDFLTQPPNRQELIARVRSLVKLKQLNRNYATLESVLLSLANAVEAKDSYTHGHTERVATLAASVGRKLDLSEEEVQAIRLGGILHDIGKIGISESILNKKGPLTDEEWTVIQSHSSVGYRICLPLSQSIGSALDIVRHHHEKLDGSSYPDGLKGEEVSIGARIVTAVDIYDALTTDRPYRSSMTVENALDILVSDVDRGRLDSRVVNTLRELILTSQEKNRRQTDSGPEKKTTILIIEDDPLNLKLMLALLHGSQYDVISETAAEAGIMSAMSEQPGLIIMDIQLPKMDGITAIRKLKENPVTKDIPVIAVSAHAMSQNIKAAKDAGCKHYITKPIDTRGFIAKIEEFAR